MDLNNIANQRVFNFLIYAWSMDDTRWNVPLESGEILYAMPGVRDNTLEWCLYDTNKQEAFFGQYDMYTLPGVRHYTADAMVQVCFELPENPDLEQYFNDLIGNHLHRWLTEIYTEPVEISASAKDTLKAMQDDTELPF